jgi:hypothetical protein
MCAQPFAIHFYAIAFPSSAAAAASSEEKRGDGVVAVF